MAFTLQREPNKKPAENELGGLGTDKLSVSKLESVWSCGSIVDDLSVGGVIAEVNSGYWLLIVVDSANSEFLVFEGTISWAYASFCKVDDVCTSGGTSETGKGSTSSNGGVQHGSNGLSIALASGDTSAVVDRTDVRDGDSGDDADDCDHDEHFNKAETSLKGVNFHVFHSVFCFGYWTLNFWVTLLIQEAAFEVL
jgi:hypothetical protein